MAEDPKEILKRARARMAAQMAAQKPAPVSTDADDDVFREAKKPKAVVPGVLGSAATADPRRLWDAASAAPRGAGVSSLEREQVISTAATLFARGGFRKRTLDEVAAICGLPKATVLAVAPTKEGLLYEAVSREVDSFLIEARKWIEPRLEASFLLEQIAARAFEYIGHHALLMQLMLGFLSDVAPEWDAKFFELRTKFAQVIQEALKVGIQQKVIRANIDLEVVASIMFEMHVAAYVLHLRDTPDKQERAQRRRSVAMDLLMNGLKA